MTLRHGTPPPADFPRRHLLGDLVEQDRTLQAQRAATAADRQSADRALVGARERDEQARSRALRLGEPLPPSEETAAREKARAAQERLDALNRAQWDLRDEMTARVEQVREVWLHGVDTQVRDAAVEFLAALETAAQAWDDLCLVQAEGEWVGRFPTKPSIIAKDPGVALHGVERTVRASQIFAALRAAAADSGRQQPKPAPIPDDRAVMRDDSARGGALLAFPGGDAPALLVR